MGRGSRIRRAAAGLLIVFLGVGAVGALWLWRHRGVLKSDPAAPRSVAAYDRMLRPLTNQADLPPPFTPSIEADRNGPVSIRLPAFSDPKGTEAFAFELHLPQSNRLELAEGSLALKYLSVAWTVPSTNVGYVALVPSRYFTWEGQELAPDEAARIPFYEKLASFQGSFPAAEFYLLGTNFPDYKPLGFAVFDARTRRVLTQGHGAMGPARTGKRREAFSMKYRANVRLWHQTPLGVAVTFAVGPVQVRAMETRAGTDLAYPGGFISLLFVTNQVSNSWGSQSDGNTNKIALEFRAEEPGSKKPTTTFIFSSGPARSPRRSTSNFSAKMAGRWRFAIPARRIKSSCER